MSIKDDYGEFGESVGAFAREGCMMYGVCVLGPETISEGRNMAKYLENHEKDLEVFSVPKGLGMFLLITQKKLEGVA